MAKFMVNYTICGNACRTIEADDLAAAKLLINAEVESDDFNMDLDRIDNVDFHVSEMVPVTRDGRKLWTTYARPSDEPGHGEPTS